MSKWPILEGVFRASGSQCYWLLHVLSIYYLTIKILMEGTLQKFYEFVNSCWLFEVTSTNIIKIRTVF